MACDFMDLKKPILKIALYKITLEGYNLFFDQILWYVYCMHVICSIIPKIRGISQTIIGSL